MADDEVPIRDEDAGGELHNSDLVFESEGVVADSDASLIAIEVEGSLLQDVDVDVEVAEVVPTGTGNAQLESGVFPATGASLRSPLGEMGKLFEQATKGGLFPLVAYGWDDNRGSVLTTSIPRLPLSMEIIQGVDQEYNLGRSMYPNKMRKLADENPHVFRMTEAQIPGLGSAWKELGRIARTYSAPYYAQKGFGLVDICDFSRLDYPEQLAQLYSLTQALGSSIRRFSSFRERLRIGNIFGHRSTGDGFYIWHDSIGGNADVATFALLVCILAQSEAMRTFQGFRMRLKASFFVGGAYMLYDRSETTHPQVATNAVGPAVVGQTDPLPALQPTRQPG